MTIAVTITVGVGIRVGGLAGTTDSRRALTTIRFILVFIILVFFVVLIVTLNDESTIRPSSRASEKRPDFFICEFVLRVVIRLNGIADGLQLFLLQVDNPFVDGVPRENTCEPTFLLLATALMLAMAMYHRVPLVNNSFTVA